MNSTQNERINQITSSTLIVGVDIAKFKHVARAQDYRGVEFGKPITFENNREGFELFVSWFWKISTEQGFLDVIVGMEPTGHYWLNLAHFLIEKQVKYGVVNPLHVKKSKELDDNSPTKNDVKDAKVIAQLVKDGRYAVPSLPQGVYAELREAMKIREHLSTDLCVVQARVHNWLDRYFPEFLTVFKDWECKSAIQMLSLYLLPHELVSVPDETLLMHLREAAKRGLGLGRIRNLKAAASRSVGIKQGSELAKMELHLLLTQYEFLHSKLEELEAKLDELLLQIPHVQQLLAIKGIGRDTVAGFLAEVGDIGQYRHPKQITKLAGLNLKTNSSGTHTGQTRITKRGRKRLRALLFRVMMPLVAKNAAFRALHEYYTKRQNNPLKKMQSLIALCNKLIRILFGILKKGHEFKEEKMMQDIPRCTELRQAA
ncbi:IS110 family transposase [Paenibacillus prosopidis]|uniref:Transposase IS116/IS110/IS902 family protein n=1 Tax=Paenibacillus prosopidis TaxID=630520 RepID=A0A368VKZ2_9BACL|nr:IS110 family transposase [Paenibacillus prosopidis]RCW40332.1 transposase IS116/IS110/IS902 family protein [Paenibacillus prosopidis]